MKKTIFLSLLASILSLSLFAQRSSSEIVDKNYVQHLINELAADEMEGRHALTPSIGRAADFIASQFKDIGLKPYAENNYRQTFSMYKITRLKTHVTWNNKELNENEFLVIGNNEHINIKSNSSIQIKKIKEGDDFAFKFREYAQSNEDLLVLVDSSFTSLFQRFNKLYPKENIVGSNNDKMPTKVFVIANNKTDNYIITAENNIKKIELFNVAAVIPGKSKPNEYVIFSSHYDHIGIIEGDSQDSIANGADDDASGTAAMISLAKYYKKRNNNERTLIFVAFTAEEIGMFGSKYFSNNINPDSVIAMLNIEMIGKDSKFGPNTLYITGFERSNLGKLMQINIKDTGFEFHPDPFPQYNLFYRSDNAVLAALGVPAHTFSTSQMDKDNLYHTVKDEVNSLDVDNITSSIKAIAIGAEGIVNGTQTPTRVEKLTD